jgi:hypothetical protein
MRLYYSYQLRRIFYDKQSRRAKQVIRDGLLDGNHVLVGDAATGEGHAPSTSLGASELCVMWAQGVIP